MLSDFEFKAKPGAPPPSGRSSSACSHPSWGVVEQKAKRGRALGRLASQEGMELDTVVSGSAGKRRRNGDNGNDRLISSAWSNLWMLGPSRGRRSEPRVD
jgi:hypothetical protein